MYKRNIYVISLILLLFLSSYGKLFANNTQLTGEQIEELIAKAESGDAKSQYELSLFYAQDYKTQQDYEKASKLLMDSAENGYAPAQFLVGTILIEDNQSHLQGIEFLNKASSQGYDSAQSFLALLYFDGRGVKKDYIKAKGYAEKAALHDNATAQFILGSIYIKGGYGVKQNCSDGIKWLEESSRNNNILSSTKLGFLYRDGECVKQNYYRAKAFFEKSADKGDACAQGVLGNFYLNGHGVKQNYFKAREYFEKCAIQNDSYCNFKLGLLYEYGKGVRQNINKAKEYYGIACDKGSQDGCDSYAKLNKRWCQLSNDKIFFTVPFTWKAANRAIVRSTISSVFDTTIDFLRNRAYQCL